MPKAAATEEAAVESQAEESHQATDEAFASPPDMSELVKAEVNQAVSGAVSAALAAAMPMLIQAVREQGTPQVAKFPQGMSPSENVPMSYVPTAEIKADYLKHYRLDDVVSGKYQELNMDLVDAGVDINDAVMKGSWIHFANGHFYATTKNQVRYLDWKMRTNPGCRIYEDEGAGVIPCTVVNCTHTFVNEKGLMNHLRATHGVSHA